MKHFKYMVAATVLTAGVWLTSCNDRNNSSDNNQDKNDTSLTDTRRNTTDTVNYLTKDSGNKSQDIIDPNEPPNSSN